MKSIIFMRHSFAEAGYDKADFERAITEDGFDKIDMQAVAFNKKGIQIDYLLSSSAVRTQQTTRSFIQAIQQHPLIQFEDWIYEDYSTTDFIEALQEITEDKNTILFVGHNPSISMLATQMAQEGYFGFQPASILKLDFDINSWASLEARSGIYDFYLA